MVPDRIYFVTGNKKKLEEVLALECREAIRALTCSYMQGCLDQVVAIIEAGQQLPFHIEGKSADLPELQVCTNSRYHPCCRTHAQGEPEDIARQKCRLAAQQVPVLMMAAINDNYQFPHHTAWLCSDGRGHKPVLQRHARSSWPIHQVVFGEART